MEVRLCYLQHQKRVARKAVGKCTIRRRWSAEGPPWMTFIEVMVVVSAISHRSKVRLFVDKREKRSRGVSYYEWPLREAER